MSNPPNIFTGFGKPPEPKTQNPNAPQAIKPGMFSLGSSTNTNATNTTTNTNIFGGGGSTGTPFGAAPSSSPFGAQPAAGDHAPKFGTGGGSIFGQNQSSAPAPPSLFGGATTAAPAPLFGGATSSAPAPLFGGAATAPSTTSAPAPFGGIAPSTTSAPAPLFGGAGTSAPAPSLFGNAPPPSGTAPPLFGGAAPNTTGTTATSGPPLFGGGAATPGPRPGFGADAGSTTTPAGTPSAGGGLFSGFGKPSGGGGAAPSLFGTSKPAETAPAAQPGGIFGSTTSSAANPPFGVTPAPAPSTGSNTLFAAPTTPASTEKPSGNPLFGGFKMGGEIPKTPLTFGAAPGAGSTTPAVTPPAQAAPSSTATAPTFGSFSKPTEPSATAPKIPPSLFPTPTLPSAQPEAAKTAAPSFGGGLFNLTKAAESSAPPASVQPPAPGGLFSGFGAKTTSPAAPDKGKEEKKEEAPQKETAPAVGGLFGGFGVKKPDEPNSTAVATTTAPTAPKDASQPTTASAPNPAPLAPIAAAAPTPPSALRGKSIEEIVNKWDKELQSNVQEYTRIANEVSAWDKVLIENGNYISQLYSQVLAAEATQQLVEQTLSSVEMQQQELGATLEAYERQAKEILDGTGGGLRALETGPADAERDRNYTLAATLSTSLDDLTKSLGTMIESVNELSIQTGNEASVDQGGDPLTQIAEVLNEHLASLNWIDGQIGEMEGKVRTVGGRMTAGTTGTNGNAPRSGWRAR